MATSPIEHDLRATIRTIANYPKPGIMFRDITTLLGDARAFRRAVDELVQPWAGAKIDKVAGIEARGFILGGAVAHQVSAGFIPIRKKGKLPHTTVRIAYSLEYGLDEMEMHEDAVVRGDRIVLVDDLGATRCATEPYSTEEVPLSATPTSGTSGSAAASGSGSNAKIPSAVRLSVRSTVASTPMRTPMKVHTSFPAAPPANARVRARPMVGKSAPLARSRNGSKVRNAIRVALSIMPIDSRTGNPVCPPRNTRCSDRSGPATAAAAASCGSSR